METHKLFRVLQLLLEWLVAHAVKALKRLTP